eukprot:TRINITY_DN4936_c0_g1_i4.p1 TRINITY_DN4936_c0_g1~~TRINITY_DN4936_c0_g1_i4.p1  ORF type:complete len:254 (+),score=44.95 TRINITY_DN4936_c0_g1_i4:24-764(+)
MFTSRPLPHVDPKGLYDALVSSVEFERLGSGREGAILVDDRDGRVPIHRSTTPFSLPLQRFKPIHHELVQAIGLPLNNAMIERYTSSYRKMGWHSDHALDLADDGYIAVVSAYSREPEPHEVRKLHIVPKGQSQDTWDEVPLDHATVVLFSAATNQTWLHRIMLDSPKQTSIEWVGVTFRLSKTFVEFREGVPYLSPGGVPLHVASEQERHAFFKAKGQQNAHEGSYDSPIIDYSLSVGDTLPPRG